MNSHQRRKRRRYWERAFRRFNALTKQVYGPLIPSLIPRRGLFGEVT